MEIDMQSTQDKIWNPVRRTYIGKSDLKEGEKFCNKCERAGEIPSNDGPWYDCCPKCQGRGIVNWIENVVGVPPITAFHGTSSYGRSAYSGIFGNGTSGRN